MNRVRLLPTPAKGVPHPDEACLNAFQEELDYIFRTLRRLGVAAAEREDLAHETFLVLRRKWGEYDSSRPLRPYLFGIIFRVAGAHQRRRVREVPLLALAAEGRDAMQPELAFQAKQARALVLAALDRIPLPRRAVLVMHDIDEVPMREVAASLSIPLFTAYSRLRKARKELAAAHRRLQPEDRSS
jgi:RNA polymerase sigma-70 factor (ECF subfamily)